MKTSKIIAMLCITATLTALSGCSIPFLGQQETEATEEEIAEETTTTTTVASVFVIKEELDYEDDPNVQKEEERRRNANDIIKEIDEYTDVDEIIETVLSTNEYKEADYELKRSIVKRLMTKLSDVNLISGYYYESTSRQYTYTYLDDTEGRIKLDD